MTRADALGFTPPRVVDLDMYGAKPGARLRDFIAKDYHGTMTWLSETADRRAHPQTLWPEARSAIIVGMNYGPDTDPLVTLGYPTKGTISVYARNKDYHDVMKGRLKELAGLLARDTGADVKVFVDTAPLMEKPLAARAGLGWQGKHTNLISRDHGSWLFLGVILSAAKLTADSAEIDHCGTCRACLDICPTDAFPAPYQLDARKCISYLTIEHKGPIDDALRAKMGNRIYGCDDCLAICPWNKFAHTAREAKLKAREPLKAPDLQMLLHLTDTEFRAMFAGSPIKRIGHIRFLRNVIYAIGNSGETALVKGLESFTLHQDAVIRDASRWAIDRLCGRLKH